MKDRKAEKDVRSIVERLVEIRKSKKVSHHKLAAKTGLSRTAISFTESGRSAPTFQTILRLCKALDVELSNLLKEIGR